MTIKLYVAQKVEDTSNEIALAKIKDYEHIIEDEGLDIAITAWYITRMKEMVDAGAGHPEAEEIAFECISDVKKCDVFVLDLRGEGAPGGSLVETGVAMAENKPVYVLEHPKSRHYSNRAMVAGYGQLQGRYTNIREMLHDIQVQHLIRLIRNSYYFTYDGESITLRLPDGSDGVTFRAIGDDMTYLVVERAIPEEDELF
jgi:nucleoside 2-deoxyribosyltransferase